MIISKYVDVTLNSANIEYFKNLGYENLKPKNIITVPIEHLNKGSHMYIDVKCDYCECEKKIQYKTYLLLNNDYGYYTCRKCSQKKIEKTNLEKYGVKYYSMTDECKEQFKEMCLEKYGVENPSQDKKIKKKRKKTMNERFGVDYYVLSDDFLEKSRKTSMENYGTPHPSMSEERKTIQKENLIKKGYNVETDEFKIFKNQTHNQTKKLKKKLLEMWDGYDYYDSEYIKNNFELPYYHGNYPTIDHKITIFEGYKMNMTKEELSKIDNLCITKRCINSKKNRRNECDFNL